MRNLILFVAGAGLCMCLSACSDETVQTTASLPAGTYTGTFTVQYNDNSSYSAPVSLVISGKRYSCSSGENRIPAGGTGTFEVKGTQIVFSEESIWTADFDWNLILSGEYSLTVAGSQVEISNTTNSLGTYRYRLEKASH